MEFHHKYVVRMTHMYAVFIGKYSLYDPNMTSTGGSRAKKLKVENVDEKVGILKMSPLQFVIVQK